MSAWNLPEGVDTRRWFERDYADEERQSWLSEMRGECVRCHEKLSFDERIDSLCDDCAEHTDEDNDESEN